MLVLKVRKEFPANLAFNSSFKHTVNGVLLPAKHLESVTEL